MTLVLDLRAIAGRFLLHVNLCPPARAPEGEGTGHGSGPSRTDKEDYVADILSPGKLRAAVTDTPVIIAGPTASGKSELALRIAERDGACIINADASQV